MKKQEGLPQVVQFFDALPDSANVGTRTVEMLESLSRTTIWRRVQAGTFPAPEPKPEGTKAARWNVGKLRAARKSYVHKA